VTTAEVLLADNLEWMRSRETDSVDLVFTSPPYEAARTYGIGFNLRGQEFVDWCVERYLECVRISRGLVAWVIAGQTNDFRWSATPAMLMADLHRRGVRLRTPPIFHRIGICGSGSVDWLRNDYEFIVCASKGRLPWSDNTAMGHPPKWAPGGTMSHRQSNGARVNQWGHSVVVRSKGRRPSHKTREEKLAKGAKEHTKTMPDGEKSTQVYDPPTLANPGNKVQESYTTDEVLEIIGVPGDVIHCDVGGGRMGSKLAHKNEAPFPESLAEFFIRSFCPPDGLVYDPHAGSGTTLAVAIKNGRYGIGTDVRESQVELSLRRIQQATGIVRSTTPSLFAG
jgi:DNA modification methylase